jgi:hypothetical protein
MHSLSKSWLVIGVMMITALCASPAFADETQQRLDEPRLDAPNTETQHALLGCRLFIEALHCPLLAKEETHATAL